MVVEGVAAGVLGAHLEPLPGAVARGKFDDREQLRERAVQAGLRRLQGGSPVGCERDLQQR